MSELNSPEVGIADEADAYSKKTYTQPKSFRLTPDDNASLQQIVKAVNRESRRKISETKVIQALIQIGTKTPPSKLIKALGEIL
jgi:hypothetical protein